MKIIKITGFVVLSIAIILSAYVAYVYYNSEKPRASVLGTMAREGMRLYLNQPDTKGDYLNPTGKKLAAKEKAWDIPAAYTNTIHIVNDKNLELLKHKFRKSNKAILHLHGGAYYIPLTNRYRDIAILYSKLSEGATVASLDYSVAPEYVFPKALEDALASWDFLLAQGYKPENIIIAGDSSGGNLALALTLKLRDANKPLPAGLILQSPWTDMSNSLKSRESNYAKDPMFGKNFADLSKGSESIQGYSITTYAGKSDLKNPYLSPAFAEYHNFPPMLIQVGNYEVLQDDSKVIYEKATQEGVKAKLSVYNGMFHIFQLFQNFIPESKQAWYEVGEFIEEIFHL